MRSPPTRLGWPLAGKRTGERRDRPLAAAPAAVWGGKERVGSAVGVIAGVLDSSKECPRLQWVLRPIGFLMPSITVPCRTLSALFSFGVAQRRFASVLLSLSPSACAASCPAGRGPTNASRTRWCTYARRGLLPLSMTA